MFFVDKFVSSKDGTTLLQQVILYRVRHLIFVFFFFATSAYFVNGGNTQLMSDLTDN